MMRKLALALGIVVLVLATVVGPILAAEGDTDAEVQAVDYATLLLPLVLAATAVERILEMIFDLYENAILKASRFLNVGGQYLKFARERVRQAREAIDSVQSVITQVAKDEAFRKALAKLQVEWQRRTGASAIPAEVEAELRVEVEKKLLEDRIAHAEQDLALAEQRLVEYLDSPLYRSGKGAATFFGGLLIGLAIALASQIRMFALLGIEVNAVIDMLVTGLIIGTGSAPVHALIGILQNTKSAVDEARALMKGKSIASLSGFAAQLTARPEGTLAEASPVNEVEYRRLIAHILR